MQRNAAGSLRVSLIFSLFIPPRLGARGLNRASRGLRASRASFASPVPPVAGAAKEPASNARAGWVASYGFIVISYIFTYA